jgi:hypothetical protein
VHDFNYGTIRTPAKVPRTQPQPVRKGRSHGLTGSD